MKNWNLAWIIGVLAYVRIQLPNVARMNSDESQRSIGLQVLLILLEGGRVQGWCDIDGKIVIERVAGRAALLHSSQFRGAFSRKVTAQT